MLKPLYFVNNICVNFDNIKEAKTAEYKKKIEPENKERYKYIQWQPHS